MAQGAVQSSGNTQSIGTDQNFDLLSKIYQNQQQMEANITSLTEALKKNSTWVEEVQVEEVQVESRREGIVETMVNVVVRGIGKIVSGMRS